MCFRQEKTDFVLESYNSIKELDPHYPQDVLIKFKIPSSERDKILKFLFSVNVTPYTSIPTEENFMKSLWIKEYNFKFNRNTS